VHGGGGVGSGHVDITYRVDNDDQGHIATNDYYSQLSKKNLTRTHVEVFVVQI
jgi:hypothetical protein